MARHATDLPLLDVAPEVAVGPAVALVLALGRVPGREPAAAVRVAQVAAHQRHPADRARQRPGQRQL